MKTTRNITKQLFFNSFMVLFSIITLQTSAQNNTILQIQKNKRWGAMNRKKQIIIPPKFDYVCQIGNSRFAIVNENGKKGIYNSKGNQVVPIAFVSFKVIDKDNIICWNDTAMGLYHNTKKCILKPVYKYYYKHLNDVISFYNDSAMAIVHLPTAKDFYYPFDSVSYGHTIQNKTRYFIHQNRKTGLLNGELDTVIGCRYDKIMRISANPTIDKYLVINKGKKGVINLDGKIIIPVDYDAIDYHKQSFVVQKNEKYGLFDVAGKMQFDTIYSRIYLKNDYWYIGKNVKNGLFDTLYQQKIPVQYEKIIPKHNAWLVSLHRKWGVYDNKFHKRLSTEFQDLKYDDGLWFVKQNGRWGVVDQDYRIIIQPKFDKIRRLANNIIGASIDNLFGIIDMNGNTVAGFMYNGVKRLNDEFFVLYSTSKAGVISNSGKQITRIVYLDVDMLNGRYLKLKTQEGILLADKNGKILISEPYDDIIEFSDSHFLVKRKNQFGLIRVNGKKVIPTQYDNIEAFGDDYFKVSLDQYEGLYNRKGNIIIKPRYKGLEYDSQAGTFLVRARFPRYDLSSLTEYEYEISTKDTLPYSAFRPDSIPYDISRFYTKKLDSLDIDKNFCWGVINTHSEILLDTVYDKELLYYDTNGRQYKIETDTALIVVSMDADGKYVDKTIYRNYVKLNLRREKTDNTNRNNNRRSSRRRRYIWQRCNRVTNDYFGLWGLRRGPNGPFAIFYTYTSYRQYRNDSNLFITSIGSRTSPLQGVVDQQRGKEILPCIFAELCFADFENASVMRCITRTGKYSLVARDFSRVGKYWQHIDPFVEKYARVTRKGKMGMIDRSGNLRLALSYDTLEPYFNNKIIAASYNPWGSRWGVVNINGDTLVDFKYRRVAHFIDETKRKDCSLRRYYELINKCLISTPFYKALSKSGWGVIDSTGKELIPFKYQKIKYFGNKEGHFFAVKENGYWGVLNQKGEQVIPIIYDEVKYLKNDVKNLFLASFYHPQSGYVDNRGNVIANAQYIDAYPYQGGFARVQHRNGKWMYLNSKGKAITSLKFQETRSFSENLAAVKIDDLWGFIDTTGKIVIKPRFLSVSNFCEGKAVARIATKSYLGGLFGHNSRTGYIDRNGQFIIKPKFSYCRSFSKNRAVVCKRKRYMVINQEGKSVTGKRFHGIEPFNEYNLAVVRGRDGREGLINRNGKTVVSRREYDKIYEFSEGYAAVQTGREFGYIDTTGTLCITPERYTQVGKFNQGIAWYSVGRRCGYQTKDSILTPPHFRSCSDFSNGYGLVCSRKHQQFFINKKAEPIPWKLPYFLQSNQFHNNIARYQEAPGNIQYVDLRGTNIFLTNFRIGYYILNDMAIVQTNSRKWGVITTLGNYLYRPVFDNFYIFSEHKAQFTFNKLHGIYASNGKLIVDHYSYNIEPVDNDLFRVETINDVSYINKKGEIFVEEQ